jgi:hypothetical protein
MPNELSGDAELTAQCTATRMFAIYQSTALFWALAEKKLIDPQHVFALGFEEMAANISADDTQGRINQLTAEMLREFEDVIKNAVDNAIEDRAGVSVESIRSDRATARRSGAPQQPVGC